MCSLKSAFHAPKGFSQQELNINYQRILVPSMSLFNVKYIGPAANTVETELVRGAGGIKWKT
jgi:hypothetical protein